MEIPSNKRIAENIAKIKHIHLKNPKIQGTAASPPDNQKGENGHLLDFIIQILPD